MPTEDPFIVALASLVIGLILGAILGRILSGSNKQCRTLAEEVRRKDDELKIYQQNVTEHFVKTSELVNNLTQSYKDVHQHLAASAMKLTSPEISKKLLEAGSGELSKSTAADNAASPPKDYTPDISGILDESYGLEKGAATGKAARTSVHATTHSTEKKPYGIDSAEDDPTEKT